MSKLRKEFRDPGTEWRGAPFWAWNAALDEKELRRQVRDMKKHGLDGFFMHPRVGMETEYVSQEYLDLIAATVDEAKKTGMHAWLYDEDRWPSGFGGGLVTARGDEYRQKYLTMETSPAALRKRKGKVGKFAVKLDGERLVEFKKGVARGTDWRSVVFLENVAGPVGWFNDDAYSDNMNPDCVKAFIDVSYKPLKKAVGTEFGKTVPGCFTDEPNVMSHHGVDPETKVLPWTTRLPAEFRKRRGYTLVSKLPLLFFDGPGGFKVRHDYWRTVTELFVEAYTKQIGGWCARNGISLTGHMLCEGDLIPQIFVGGAAMPHYEYMQTPGIDILCEQIEENLTVKQCSSVARQMGYNRVLSELYGCSSWAFTFEGQKWVGDWQMALGVNLRCQHLTWYTMKGSAKRDYPPCFNYQNPVWKYYRVVEDYFARLSLILSTGKPERDVLVVHPISTAWGHMKGRDSAEVTRVEKALKSTVEDLLSLHRDFDFGDEIIMGRHARARGKTVDVGEATYRLVVLPHCETLASSTVKLLKKYIESGGRMVVVGCVPSMIDGKPSKDLPSIFDRANVQVVGTTRTELSNAIDDFLPARVRIRNAEGREIGPIIYQERRHGKRTFVFMANRDREQGYRGTLDVRKVGSVESWDLKTGKAAQVGARVEGKYTSIPFELPPTGSAVHVVESGGRSREMKTRLRTVVKRIALDGPWEHRRTELNAIQLDFCRYRIGNRRWSNVMPVLAADVEIRKSFGVYRPTESRWVYMKRLKKIGKPVEIIAEIDVKTLPDGDVFLALEESHGACVTVNGKTAPRAAGWWMDRCIGKVKLTGLLKRGRNEIVVAWSYRDGMQIEEMYLIGEFGVDANRRLVAEPDALDAGDYGPQGYPYYSGAMVYGKNVTVRRGARDRAVLALKGYDGVLALVRVNGKKAGDFAWPPYEVDITRFLRAGKNQLEIEVVGSPRNLLGPNHYIEKYPPWTGPGQFVTSGPQFVAEYQTIPQGLKPGAQLLVER